MSHYVVMVNKLPLLKSLILGHESLYAPYLQFCAIIMLSIVNFSLIFHFFPFFLFITYVFLISSYFWHLNIFFLSSFIYFLKFYLFCVLFFPILLLGFWNNKKWKIEKVKKSLCNLGSGNPSFRQLYKLNSKGKVRDN